jgi:dephospho-CoA kinase
MEEIVEAEEKIVVVDVPLLYESGYNRFCDPIIVVKADEAVTTQRLKEKGFSLEEIKARRKAQWPLEEKIKKADWVIDNSGKFHQTRREVESLWKKLHTVSKGAL